MCKYSDNLHSASANYDIFCIYRVQMCWIQSDSCLSRWVNVVSARFRHENYVEVYGFKKENISPFFDEIGENSVSPSILYKS